jgi:uncharacterized protein YdeI (YjbR/CyaY-like superfamily)
LEKALFMAQPDPNVDKYISDSADFARPILEHWRQLVHATCPGVVEAIKWSIPHFDYQGDFMCVMTSYKSYCSFTFLKAPLMSDPRLSKSKEQKPVQRFLGKITKLSDLPADDEFIALLKEAMHLNESGAKLVRPKADPKELETPAYFLSQLDANPKAKEIFESKSPSFRKNYVVWITDAKTEATRQKRIDQSLEWIAEGKGRFWQSEK